MAKSIAITNQKGGVGKTTVAVNLASGLGKAGKKTLLVDLDSQGNASASCGFILDEAGKTLKDLLKSGGDVRDFIVTSGELDILPANNSLKDIEGELLANTSFDRLKTLLEPVLPLYDYIVIDCPPSINVFTKNGLKAARHLIIPVDVGYFSLLGMKQLLEEIHYVQEAINPDLAIMGVLASKYDRRTTLSAQILETLKNSFPEHIFTTIIKANIDIVRSQIAHKNVFDYNPRGQAAQDFRSLVEEVLNG